VGRERGIMLMASIAMLMGLIAAPSALATPPSVGVGASASTVRVNQTVGFTATASGNDGATIASLSWDFGDGSGAGSDATVSHAYGATGRYTVTVTAVDSNGESASASASVRVVGNPTASFGFSPTTPNIGDTVSFDGRGSSDPGGGIASYAWSFGDGTNGSGAQPTHSYATGGDKTVTLTITAALDGLTAFTSKTVHVNIPPRASFVFAAVNAPAGQDPFTPVLGQQVALSAQSSSDPDGSITSWAWDLGTGTFGAPASVSWLLTNFTTPGRKDVRLKVTDNGGASTIATTSFRVNSPPVAGFDISPTSPQTGDKVTFSSTASDPDGVADLGTTSWDLNGDGTYGDATGATASAVFLTAGTYTIGEKVTDKGGAAGVLTKQLTVVGPPAPPPTGDPGGTPPAVVPGPGQPVVLGVSPSARAPGTATTATVSATSARTTAPALRGLRGVRVQLAGSVTGARTRITRMLVLGPAGAVVTASCHGSGCPRRALRGTIAGAAGVRLKGLELTLRAGTTITISLRRAGYATKRITLTMRRARAPRRVEACLVKAADGRTKVGSCPAA
jgi:PKD repeat protein